MAEWSNETSTVYNWSALELLTEHDLAAVELFKDYPRDLLVFTSISCIIFMIIGIPGNLITIIALARYKKARNATAIFIINLSSSDLIYCCVNLPLSASTFLTHSWPYGATLCRLFPLARFGLAAVSLFTILAITTNRYILISHPKLYPKLYKTRNLAIIIAFTWIFSFGALIATWLEEWGRFGMDPQSGFCVVLPDSHQRSPVTALFLCAFLIPCLTIFLCYARIFWVVRKTTKRSQGTVRRKRTTVVDDSSVGTSNGQTPDSDNETSSGPPVNLRLQCLKHAKDRPVSFERTSTPSSDNSEGLRRAAYFRRSLAALRSMPSSKDRRLLTMITAIMLAFFICHLPITVIEVCREVSGKHPVAVLLSYVLRYLTTCINPVIYVVMSSEYRKAYTKVFCDWR